ncbi:MAG: type 3 dihydrofolate reductase [Mariprofundaceae bacterium]
MTQLSLIWAEDQHRLIGVDNHLPWKLPADMRWFRKQTMGKPVLMGRKTFDSIGKPLPGRTNLVLTREKSLKIPGCTVVHSLDAARSVAAHAPEIMVIGGAEIYALALPEATKLYITKIEHRFEGDAWFPAFDLNDWQPCFHEYCEPDEKNHYPHTFTILTM